MKRLLVLITLCLCALLPCAGASDYPDGSIDAIVQWGAGGGTDCVMRPLCAIAEKELGAEIIVRNMPGGTGSIAAQYVYDQNCDGYTLLLGAENPALYKALGISDLTYDDFTCVFLVGDETCGVIVNANSEYNSFTQLIKDALDRPGEITVSTTGNGGLPWEVCHMITSVTGAEFNQIPYDSDASARTAVISGECVFTICKVQTGIEAWKKGDVKYLTMIDDGAVDAMAGIPAVVDEYPEFSRYLPWGPFYGVFVKKGTDEAIVNRLSAAFRAAFEDDKYQELLSNLNINALGYTGEEAYAFISNWSDVTIEALKTGD